MDRNPTSSDRASALLAERELRLALLGIVHPERPEWLESLQHRLGALRVRLLTVDLDEEHASNEDPRFHEEFEEFEQLLARYWKRSIDRRPALLETLYGPRHRR